MMGEFILYKDGKIFGGIYDDRFLVKPTKSAMEKMPKAPHELPYEGEGILEIKNIATEPNSQGKGYARALLEFVEEKFRDEFTTLQVGTGDSPLTIPFYEKCGFSRHHVIKDFFTKNYDHPIIECGVQLVDMIVLRKKCDGKTVKLHVKK